MWFVNRSPDVLAIRNDPIFYNSLRHFYIFRAGRNPIFSTWTLQFTTESTNKLQFVLRSYILVCCSVSKTMENISLNQHSWIIRLVLDPHQQHHDPPTIPTTIPTTIPPIITPSDTPKTIDNNHTYRHDVKRLR